MESNTRVAIVGIVVEDAAAAETVNRILHEFGAYIIGRMGIPFREKEINVISVVMDAPPDVVNSVTGKLGMVSGISAKTLLAKV